MPTLQSLTLFCKVSCLCCSGIKCFSSGSSYNFLPLNCYLLRVPLLIYCKPFVPTPSKSEPPEPSLLYLIWAPGPHTAGHVFTEDRNLGLRPEANKTTSAEGPQLSIPEQWAELQTWHSCLLIIWQCDCRGLEGRWEPQYRKQRGLGVGGSRSRTAPFTGMVNE